MISQSSLRLARAARGLALPAQNAGMAVLVLAVLICAGTGCRRQSGQKQGVRPRTLRDVPAGRLAYQFSADTDAPANAAATDASQPLASIQKDFDTRRPDDALLRTAISPDRQRALAVYATGEDQANEFRIDLYGVAGDFQRHVTPAGLAVVFAPVADWSPDGNFIAFIGYKSSTPQPSPTPLEDSVPGIVPGIAPGIPTASPSPLQDSAPTVRLFNTEQVYVCSRDGFDLKPLTSREGLIYFFLNWSPDSHAIVALACKENEWRERPLLPAGRPRLIGIDGGERLLDDGLTDVLPVWSPDASKVATAFDTNVRIYDALTNSPTQADIELRDQLMTASRAYDDKARITNTASGDSFLPIVTLSWQQPETIHLQTGFVRNFENEQVRNLMRWHLLRLSAQAALLN